LDAIERTTDQSANTAMATTAPVTEKSSWVTPCWIRSPVTMSRISSNGDISASSRLPDSRVTHQTAQKRMVARITISMEGLLGTGAG
jgi:hypothetical protein